MSKLYFREYRGNGPDLYIHDYRALVFYFQLTCGLTALRKMHARYIKQKRGEWRSNIRNYFPTSNTRDPK